VEDRGDLDGDGEGGEPPAETRRTIALASVASRRASGTVPGKGS
jgi:hypothetical protein